MAYMKSWDWQGKLDFESQLRQENSDFISKMFREFDQQRINSNIINSIDLSKIKIPPLKLDKFKI